MKESTVAVKELKLFVEEILGKAGLIDEDAQILSRSLIQADLEGVGSHGISRLPIYVKRILEGRINGSPHIKDQRPAPGIVLIDGDNGPGPVVAYRAIQAAVPVAKEIGIVAVGIKNSNHFGTASFYCQEACSNKLISMAFTNAPPGIAPWGGRKPYFGTNPVAFGFPTGTKSPIIIDMSSSVVARGKIRMAAKRGEPIPKDWAMDSNGNYTTDANAALEGAILPMGGAKGSALALMVEIISGLVTGAAFGEHVQSFNNDDHGEANVGHFFILIDVERFMNVSVYEELLQTMIHEIKQTPKAAGIKEILIPGERRARESSVRQEEGISISPFVLNELQELGKEVGVPFFQ